MDDFEYYDDSNNFEDGYAGDEPETHVGGDVDAAAALESALTAIFQSDIPLVVDPSLLLQQLRFEAGHLASLFCISRQLSLLLLRRYNFNRDTASGEFVMKPEESYKDLGISEADAKCMDNTFVGTSALGPSADVAEGPSCGICFLEDEEVEGNKLYALSSCLHFFCGDCWCDAVRGRLKSGSSLLTLRCMQSGCRQLVDLWSLLEVVAAGTAAGDQGDPNQPRPDTAAPSPTAGKTAETGWVPLSQQVRRAVLTEYIRGNPRLNWCPNPRSCDSVVFSPLSVFTSPLLMCPSCDFPFCGRCKGAPHGSATCDAVQAWQAKLTSDGASIARILSVTKACPACHERIEKNMGCNHMTCRCGHQFCWICMGTWKLHEGSSFNCLSREKKEETAYSAEMTFYSYFQGYDAHMVSLKLDSEHITGLRNRVGTIIEEQRGLFKTDISLASVRDTLKAVEKALILARLTLASTYVEAFSKLGSTDTTEEEGGAAENSMLLYRRGVLMTATEDLSSSTGFLGSAKNTSLDMSAVQQKAEHTNNIAMLFYK